MRDSIEEIEVQRNMAEARVKALEGALDLAMEQGRFTNAVWDTLIQARQNGEPVA